VKKLDVGDYSVEDYEDEVAVERKAVGDAISSVIQGRARFEREWKKAGSLKRFFIVIEGTQKNVEEEIINLKVTGRITKFRGYLKSVINTYIHWCVQYGVPVFFCEGVKEAERTTYELLRAYVKYADKGVIPVDAPNLVDKFNIGIWGDDVWVMIV